MRKIVKTVAQTFDFGSLRKRLVTGNAIPELGDGPPVAAVSVIINPSDRGGSMLLIRRTEREGDPWSGQMAFPGGHRAPKDRDFLETAIREAKEEVGIDLREQELLGFLEVVYARSRRIRVVPYVFQLKSDPVVRTNQEVAEYLWTPFSAFETSPIKRSTVHFEEGSLNVDSYVFNGHVVWGLTFRVINILLDKKRNM